jgi:hypothetical protein
VIPAWESDVEVRRSALSAGYALEPVFMGHRRDGLVTMTVYALRRQ